MDFYDWMFNQGKPAEAIEKCIGDVSIQHNTAIADGLSGLGQALEAMAKQGITMVYTKGHKVLGMQLCTQHQ